MVKAAYGSVDAITAAGMTGLIGNPDYTHGEEAQIGILLVNLGTPDAPTASAVRRYLKQFLGDPRVVETPRWLWWWILRCAVLPFRPRRTAAAYREIWKADGSPLLSVSRAQQVALQEAVAPMQVVLGMSYGKPSIATALAELRRQNCRHLLVLPLYPQYSSSTTGSVFAAVSAELSRWRDVPHYRFIADYCGDARYIDALAESIADYRRAHGGAEKLVFSFHGTPLAMLQAGDPYHCLCHKTARLTAEKLGLEAEEWMVSFQSRFGRAEWLRPYTDETLRLLPGRGVKSVQVICPAFSADCLETLEEIAGENCETFIAAGGQRYEYISALNDRQAHIAFFAALIFDATADWRAALAGANSERRRQKQLSKKVGITLGSSFPRARE